MAEKRAGGPCGLPFYYLKELLKKKKGKLTAVTIRLFSDKKMKQIPRNRYKNMQARLFERWDQNDNQKKTGTQLLKCDRTSTAQLVQNERVTEINCLDMVVISIKDDDK